MRAARVEEAARGRRRRRGRSLLGRDARGRAREVGREHDEAAVDVLHRARGQHPKGDALLGLHLLTESIDGRFTATYFRGGDGNLFKESLPGVVDNMVEKRGMVSAEEAGNKIISFFSR